VLPPAAADQRCGIGGRRPSLAAYVAVTGPTSGAAAPPEGGNVGYPHVAMKATSAPSYSDQPYPYRDIHDHLRRIYDAFGPARMFWGTDITRMPGSSA